MFQLRAWIELARVHTAGLTTALFVGGYLIAGGSVLSLSFLLWFLCGIFYHVCGFIHNNLTDYPWDNADPHKKHFPLVSGKITYRKADEIDRFLMIIFCFYAVFLTQLQAVPTLLFVVVICSGLVYDYYAKITPLAILFIANAWGLLPLISYCSQASQLNPVIVWVTVYTWVQVLIQIAVLGSVKDLEAPRENNLMRKMGCRVSMSGWLTVTNGALLFVYGMKIFHAVLLVPVLIVSGASLGVWVISWAFYFASVIPYTGLMRPVWSRKRVLAYCVLNEAFCFLAVNAALQNVFGWPTTLLMLVYPPIWVFVWLRLQYGNWRIGPRV